MLYSDNADCDIFLV